MLVSWKEIAAFLDRAERTVKRWERERGLPVHRVPGGERSGVFAYSHELSTWLLGEEGKTAETPPSAEDNHRSEESTALRIAESEAAPESHQVIDSSRLATPLDREMSNLRPLRAIVWTAVLALLTATAVFSAIRHYRALSPVKAVQLAPPGSRHASSPHAEQLYLQGRYQWSLRTAESLANSVDAYTQAIVEDPAYAQAYAGLADNLLPSTRRSIQPIRFNGPKRLRPGQLSLIRISPPGIALKPSRSFTVIGTSLALIPSSNAPWRSTRTRRKLTIGMAPHCSRGRKTSSRSPTWTRPCV